ncbi:dimethylarginine dimethylaminohydrolase family protein [Actinoplanes utahensis]|uniref:dimethylarginine dimethylaminohydrolase family protein n=1 Tax=Actinoplanes utahensis TaxID=1869 RepID=UPI00069074A9|nr:arginine deiminase family protein [Actinoplanes utahensis]GIF32179.1 amidinotransferase [Actinoplanes utahensis]
MHITDTPRRFLLCSPDHFDVTFEINPWMTTERRPDREQSWNEWFGLVSELRAAGAVVHHFPSLPGLSDMVFPTDVGVVDGDRFVRGRFRHPERRDEAAHGADWLLERGFTEIPWPDDPDMYLEGGDVVRFADGLLCGNGPRTSPAAAEHLSRVLGVPVVTVPIVDPRFYHLDMSFFPLDERQAMYAPDVWDSEGQRAVEKLVPEPLLISIEEALTFSANAVMVGRTAIMPACPPRIRAELESRGFTVRIAPVGEFLKAGGGIRCMALDLDLLHRAGHLSPLA